MDSSEEVKLSEWDCEKSLKVSIGAIIVFIILFFILLGFIIWLLVRDTPLINAVEYAANNNVYCGNPENAKVCVIPTEKIDPPEVNATYSGSSLQNAILMINNVYNKKHPFVVEGVTWTPLYSSYNREFPYGYVGFYNDINYVIFRGTDVGNEDEIKVDLMIKQVEFNNQMCHKGFVGEFDQFKDVIKEHIKKDKPLFTAGHSMGAAYALFTQMYLNIDDSNIYTVGSPRVCSCSLAEENMSGYFNVQNMVDPIVSQPPSVVSIPKEDKSLFGYCTVGSLVQFQDNRLSLVENHELSTYYWYSMSKSSK